MSANLWKATTMTTVPSQRQAHQSIANPREMGPDYWRFNPDRGVGTSKAFFPADQQSDNYRTLNEGHHRIKNGAMNPLTGEEPIYGHMHYPRNPLDQEQTNRPAYNIQKETRILDSRNPVRTMINIPSSYPQYRLGQTYLNFPTGNQVSRMRGGPFSR